MSKYKGLLNSGIGILNKLGHAQLHRKQANTILNKRLSYLRCYGYYEREANYFAAQLLIDTSVFLDFVSIPMPVLQLS